MEPLLLTALTTALSSGGAAWIGLKVALNGTRERVARMETRQDEMHTTLTKIGESVVRLDERSLQTAKDLVLEQTAAAARRNEAA